MEKSKVHPQRYRGNIYNLTPSKYRPGVTCVPISVIISTWCKSKRVMLSLVSQCSNVTRPSQIGTWTRIVVGGAIQLTPQVCV